MDVLFSSNVNILFSGISRFIYLGLAVGQVIVKKKRIKIKKLNKTTRHICAHKFCIANYSGQLLQRLIKQTSEQLMQLSMCNCHPKLHLRATACWWAVMSETQFVNFFPSRSYLSIFLHWWFLVSPPLCLHQLFKLILLVIS